MDLPSFLMRRHYLTKDECLSLLWVAMKSKEGVKVNEGYLEPSLQELETDDFDRVRPYPFGDVLKNSKDILASVLKRSGAEEFEHLIDRWHQWHVEFMQPISDFCLSPREPRPFGKRLYDNASEKRICGAWVADHLVKDSDHVIIPEGTSAFWVGLAVLARRRNLRIITSNGALVRELHENPRLRNAAKSVNVIGGEMDVSVGGTGRGFVGEAAEKAFERAIHHDPGATVVLSSVNGLLPEIGPLAPCPATGFTRRKLLLEALPNVSSVVFVADYTKIRPQNMSHYGTPIFPDRRQWQTILSEHHDRLAFVVAPPIVIREDEEIMSIRPRDRVIHGKNFPHPVVDYLNVAARFDTICSKDGEDSRFHEAHNDRKHESPVSC